VPVFYQDLDGDDTHDAAVPATDKTQIVLSGGEYRRVCARGAYEASNLAGRLARIRGSVSC
jgi:hypothetical protein